MLSRTGRNMWQGGERLQALSVASAFSKLKLDPFSFFHFSTDEDGYQLLIELERLADALQIKVASRAYRETFTRNYQCLFKDLGRHYRFDLLQAMVQECPPMHINGKEYAFTGRAIELSRRPIMYLKELGKRLHVCKCRLEGIAWERLPKCEVVNLIECLDAAWASFECQYIKELIQIETSARQPLLAAAKCARAIPAKKTNCGCDTWCLSLEQCLQQQNMLFGRIAELNAMANTVGKGRGDLNEGALKVAMDALTFRKGYNNCSPLVRGVCEDFLESFAAMCKYLRTVGDVIENVDPILSNNSGLVERLADLEESWETVVRYVQDESMRRTLDDVFTTLKRAQELEPMFQQMCSDRDVELFLVIPRIIVLAFLKDPTNDAVMKTLLPHLFRDNGTSDELESLFDHFESIVLESPVRLTDDLTGLLVHGPGTDKINEFSSKELQDQIGAFLRELERWSIELQRCQARDWNTFCAVLVQHLSCDSKKGRESTSLV